MENIHLVVFLLIFLVSYFFYTLKVNIQTMKNEDEKSLNDMLRKLKITLGINSQLLFTFDKEWHKINTPSNIFHLKFAFLFHERT